MGYDRGDSIPFDFEPNGIYYPWKLVMREGGGECTVRPLGTVPIASSRLIYIITMENDEHEQH